PSTKSVFECADQQVEGESIFEEEEEDLSGGEEEKAAPAAVPAPPASSTSIDGPSASTTWGPRLEVTRNGVEAEDEQAAIEGEATAAREAPRHIRQAHPPQQ